MRDSADTLSSCDLAESRGNMYSFLSTCLLEPPSPRLLGPLCEPDTLSNIAKVFGEDRTNYLRELAQRFPQGMEPFIQEYNDLFVVPLGRYVTPYEAVYRDERVIEGKQMKGLLMGQSTLAVLQSYGLANASVSEDVLDMPDYAGLELSFMGYLCKKQADALDRGDEQQSLELLRMQRDFLQEHLTPWMPTLCTRIRENAEGPLYKGIAELIQSFLALETETLSLPLPATA